MKILPEIAIIDANTLSSIGLQNLIEKMMPEAVVRKFNSFESFVCDTPDMYFHYFISSQILVEHSAFFVERKHKTIVLTYGRITMPYIANFHTLNICLDEKMMIRALLRLQQSAHAGGLHLPPKMRKMMAPPHPQNWSEPNGLTSREIEVLVCIVRGMANKEIAEELNISITTVISHRKNIMEKLNIKSVSGLTIYAVMNGYIEADRI